MEQTQPFLEIRSPNGHQWTFRQAQDQNEVTIGRAGSEQNDIVLGPDFCDHISRRHCILKRENAKWWLHRHGKYPPLLRRKNEQRREEEVHEKVKLADGDLIRILGQRSRKEDFYWEVHFCDRETTQPVGMMHTFLRYDEQARELYRVVRGVPQRIPLSDQELALVDCMLRKPGVVCQHDQLIAAVWDPAIRQGKWSETPTLDNLRHLITRFKAKLEPSKKPSFLITHLSEGYALHTFPVEDRK